MSNIGEQFKTVRSAINSQMSPEASFVATTKNSLMQKIHTEAQEETFVFSPSFIERLNIAYTLFVPASLKYRVLKPVGMFAAVLAVAIGGWSASVSASRDSLPNEFLYNVKLATEKVSVLTAPDKKIATKLHLEFAHRRVQEAKEVAKVDPVSAAQTVKEAGASIVSASAAVKEVAKTDVASAADLAKDLNNTAISVVAGLKDVDSTQNKTLEHEVALTASTVLDGSAKTVVGIVKEVESKGEQTGQSSVPSAQIQTLVGETVQGLLDHASDTINTIATTTPTLTTSSTATVSPSSTVPISVIAKQVSETKEQISVLQEVTQEQSRKESAADSKTSEPIKTPEYDELIGTLQKAQEIHETVQKAAQ